MNEDILFNEDTEYLLEFFKDKIDQKYTSFPSFLKFGEPFTKSGKQGLLGTLKVKTKEGKKEIVYKLSQYLNFLVEGENLMMKGLNEIREYCPHFCKGFGKITIPVDPEFRKKENPFECEDRYKIYTDVLLMESLYPARKLYRYLKKNDFDEEILYSLIKQTLLAISIAQSKKQFSHYDLHSNNILVKKCPKNSCFLYILDEDHQYLIPTYGYYPIIIDYGFGYISEMENQPISKSLDHTDAGFMSDRFDQVADPKLFLVTISDEIKNYRNTKKSKIFRSLIKNIFKPLKIDYETGWDETEDLGATDYVLSLLEEAEHKSKSKFFKEYSNYLLGLCQKLIKLPLKKQSYKKIDKMYSLIIEEFKKIEREISSDFYNLYIFKNIVDITLEVKDDYLSTDRREMAVLTFKNKVLDVISSCAKFCLPKVDFETLLCSLLIFARQMEGVLFEVIEERMLEKRKEYRKMKVTSTNEIYEAIETNLPSEFKVDEDTIIYVFDSVKETSFKTKIPGKYLTKLNEQHPLFKGEFIYDLYRKVSKLENEKESSDEDESSSVSMPKLPSEDDNNKEDTIKKEESSDEGEKELLNMMEKEEEEEIDEETDEDEIDEETDEDEYDINKKDSDFDFSDEDDSN